MKNEFSRRNFLKKASIGGISLTGLSPVLSSFKNQKPNPKKFKTKNKATVRRPNIVYIHSHDTGRYIQPYGYDVPTPNLQKLADQGVLFRQFFTPHPTSSPSRACLLTGMYPHNNGMVGLAHRGFQLKDYSQHILHTLRKYGYHSALAGIQHIANHKKGEPYKKIGYDEHISSTWNIPETKKVAKWIENAPESPFFLAVGFGETHRKFHPADWKENIGQQMPPEPIPDHNDTRVDWAKYKETARILDEKMGIVFNALERTGLDETTLVICTTDHGIAFPRMKCNLTDGGTGIFLIMRGPGGFNGGKVIDSMVSNIDIFPTVCELLNIDKPNWLQGKSIIPLVSGEKEDIHEEIFTQVDFHAAYEPQRSVRTKRYKYIKRYDKRKNPVLPNCDYSPSKQLWLDNDWQNKQLEEEQLYDLIFDPNEQNNLVENPHKKEILKDMRQRLKKHMKDTDDPILTYGYTPPPNGARVDDPDAINPGDSKIDPSYITK